MPHERTDSMRQGTTPAVAGRVRRLTLLAALALAAACGGTEDETVPIDPTPPIDTTAREGMTAAPAPPATPRA